jgi:hypothetical protein
MTKQTKPKLFPVTPHDLKIGMTISLHGTVVSAEPYVGRAKVKKGKRSVWKKGAGPKGFLFKTDAHPDGCFYQEDATVWCVR